MGLSSNNTSFLLPVDRNLRWALFALSGAVGLVALAIIVFLLLEAAPALNQVGLRRFVSDSSWNPTSGRFNLAPMVVASVVVTIGSMLIAIPLGLSSALFVYAYAPAPLAGLYRHVLQLLAGVPSVVFGFWALMVLVPVFSHGVLVAVIILALMILPTFALLAEARLVNVPEEYLQAAAALGLTRWATLRRVALPAIRSGLATGLILSFGRAIGETMAVLMVCGNVVQMPSSLNDSIRTLTANIALEMAYAEGIHRSALFVSGCLLMGIVVVLVILSELSSRSPTALFRGDRLQAQRTSTLEGNTGLSLRGRGN